MRYFNYKFLHNIEIPLDIFRIISKIYEYKGRQFFYLNKENKSLDKYILHTKLKSTISSNRIEGIFTTDKKSKEVIIDGRVPENLIEQEILGYSQMFNLIQKEYENIEVNINVILQLHRELYKNTGFSFSGKFKKSGNLIVSINQLGNRRVIFSPLKATYTENAMFNLCEALNEEIKKDVVEPLLLIPIFILDLIFVSM